MVFLIIDFGGNSIVYGILAAMYPLFQLIGAPILGKWSDAYGRKKVLLVSNGGTLVGCTDKPKFQDNFLANLSPRCIALIEIQLHEIRQGIQG